MAPQSYVENLATRPNPERLARVLEVFEEAPLTTARKDVATRDDLILKVSHPTVAVRISNVVQRYNTATREEKTTPDPHTPAITRRLDRT